MEVRPLGAVAKEVISCVVETVEAKTSVVDTVVVETLLVEPSVINTK